MKYVGFQNLTAIAFLPYYLHEKMQIIKVPGLNAFGKTKGCRNSGNAIIAKLADIYTNSRGKSVEKERLSFEEIHVNNDNLEEQERLIYENALEAFETQDRIIFLGGDHSISYPLCRAFLDYCKGQALEPCLVVFDAHLDCMSPMREPTHEEWLRALVEAGFPPGNILVVGARNNYADELEFVRKHGIKIFSVYDVVKELESFADFVTEFANGRELYVSIDIDVLDPAFAPATGYREPGGLQARELLYLVSRLSHVKTLKALDIVEINQEMSGAEITTKLAAMLVAELI